MGSGSVQVTAERSDRVGPSRSLTILPSPCLRGDACDFDRDEMEEKLDELLDGGQNFNSDSQRHNSLLREMNHRTCRKHMLDPHSRIRVAHDLFSITALALDVVTAPVVLSWDLPVEGALYGLNVCSFAFWSFDIFMSFITGFYVQGELELRPSLVAMRYFKSWFLPDVA